jgi:cell division protein FtsB
MIGIMKRKSGAGGGYWPKLYRVMWGLITVVAVIGAISLFYPQYASYAELQRREAELQEECRAAQEYLQKLKQDQDALVTDPAFAERVAREELGLARPGEHVIKFVEDQPAPAR